MDPRILVQKRLHPLRLVRRQVVDDHMNVPTPRLRREHVPQEVHKGLAGMTGHCLADNLAGLRVQRGVQQERAVAVVLESMAFRASGGERQHGIEAVQGLNRRLFIDGKHDRVLRWIQVQSDDIGRLPLEVWVVRQHVAFKSVRLQPGPPPDARDEHMTNSQHLAQLARGPMRAAIRRFLPRLRQDARFQRGRAHYFTP